MREPPDTFLPNLGVRADDVAPAVLVVGDPERAEQIAKELADARLVGANREYRTFTGTRNGVPVTVSSHGVGAPGAAICFTELIRAGARAIVRAGTCGGLQPGMTRGTIIVPTGAVRDDGASERMVPLGYPAVPDRRLADAVEASAAGLGVPVVRGVVWTCDLFYPLDVLGSDVETWRRAGVLAVEMELSTLFVVAGLHDVAAAGILVADGNVVEDGESMDAYRPRVPAVAEGIARMIDVALDALVTVFGSSAGR